MDRLHSSSLSVAESFLASTNCLLSLLNPSQRKCLENCENIEQFCDIISSSHIIESIVNQSIGFSTVHSSLDFAEELRQIAETTIESADIPNMKLFIDGPSHSGKSTLLSLLAVETIRRLTACKQLSHVFIFPINWENATQRIIDMVSLYEYIVAQTIYHLSWQCGRTFPIAQLLLNWFLSIPAAGTLPPIPMTIQGMPLFPLSPIEVLGKNIIRCFKQNDGGAIAKCVVSFPNALSSCFGFDNFLYIYDHLDSCDLDVKISPENDSTVCVLDALLSHVSQFMFLLSSKDHFSANKLKKVQYDYLHTENLIPNNCVEKIPVISCLNPQFTLNVNLCHGCPNYLHQFISIVQHLQKTNDPVKIEGFRSVYSLNNLNIAKMQVIQLCTDLADCNQDEVSLELVEEMKQNPDFDLYLKKPRA